MFRIASWYAILAALDASGTFTRRYPFGVRSIWLQRAAMALLLLAIAAGFYWKITLTNQFTWFGSQEGDIAAQVLPWLQFEAREFRHARFPLWDPHLWMGQPLLGQAQPGAAYPLNWLLFLMPLRDGLIRIESLNWYYVLVRFLAIAFAYALCRDLGRSRSASLIAGCVFGLAGFIGSTDWPQMVNGAVWAPLVLLFLLRAVRGRSPLFSAALSGGFLGLAWLSGHHQIPIYTTLAVAAVWLFFAFQGQSLHWDILRLAAIAFVAMFLVSALQTLPAYEYGKLALRWVGVPNPVAWNEPVPYSAHAQYSLSPLTLIGIFVPGVRDSGDPFVGVVALTLAIAGCALAWRERAVRIFTAIALAGLFLALGKDNVFHGILYSLVPLFEKARVPAAAVFIFQLGLIVPIAFGLDFFAEQAKSRSKFWIPAGVAVFGFLIWGVLMLAGLVNKFKFEFDDRIALTGFFAILLGGVLFAWLKGGLARNASVTALLILLLAELGNDSGFTFREVQNGHRLPEKFETSADIAVFLRQQPGPFRIQIDESELPQNFGDWYGIDVLSGYTASVLSNVMATEWWTPRDQEILNVAYYISKKPARPDQAQVFESATGLKVYRNPEAFPRAWIVHNAVVVKDMPETNRLIQDANFDLRRNVVLRSPAPAMESCSPANDQLRITRRSSGSLDMDATLACSGMAVLSESYTPGWTATVDGKPAEIREVYGAFRGVAAPGGQHRIQMRYRPFSVMAGAILTLLGVIGISILGIL
jgi:hypothetical protein